MSRIAWFTSGTDDGTIYRLLRNEEQRLEDLLLSVSPGRKHFIRQDLKSVKHAIQAAIERNTRTL